LARESRGSSVYDRIADASVHQLRDLACGDIARGLECTAARRAAFAGVPVRRTRAR